MPLTIYLEGQHIDPEARRIAGIAFELTRIALNLEEGTDPLLELVAKKIIARAQAGELDADRLCKETLAAVGRNPSSTQAASR
jgi:hypothetical protein